MGRKWADTCCSRSVLTQYIQYTHTHTHTHWLLLNITEISFSSGKINTQASSCNVCLCVTFVPVLWLFYAHTAKQQPHVFIAAVIILAADQNVKCSDSLKHPESLSRVPRTDGPITMFVCNKTVSLSVESCYLSVVYNQMLLYWLNNVT